MSSVSQSQGSDDPQKPDDREGWAAVTLATTAAAVALLLSPDHDPALAVAVFTAVAGALRPMR